jgi:hypothetical protein
LRKLEWPFRTHSVWRSSAQQSGTEPRRLLFHGILRQANYHCAGSSGGEAFCTLYLWRTRKQLHVMEPRRLFYSILCQAMYQSTGSLGTHFLYSAAF